MRTLRNVRRCRRWIRNHKNLPDEDEEELDEGGLDMFPSTMALPEKEEDDEEEEGFIIQVHDFTTEDTGRPCEG